MLCRRVVLGTLFLSCLLAGFSRASATPLAAPSGLLATSASTTQIDLSWTNNSPTAKAFLIERSLSTTEGFRKISKVLSPQAAFQDMSLAADTIYYYRIRAMKKNGQKSEYSSVGSARTTATGVSTISAPEIVTARAAGCSQVDLSWSPVPDIGSVLAGYRI